MPRRPKPWRLDDVLDGRKLRAQLTAAFLDHLGSERAARARMLDLLKGALFRGRMIAQERLEAGADGLDVARLISAVQDEVIAALYDYTTIHLFRARNPTTAERLAVVATGGYGRGAMAPSSDVDLLFLRAYKDAPWAESVTEYMLYALWDMGLKVGHATRTLDETMRAAREDMTIRTAVLEARHLVGDAALTTTLRARLRADLFAGTAREFVAAKLKERDERHARSGASRYAVEPNVKDGKGGLRDLHTLFWIAQYIYAVEGPADFIRLGVFTREEIVTFIKAMQFLWSVRCHLHFVTGRAEERLTFDLQPELAQRMGYVDRGAQAGVERLMKRYFLVAKDVGGLTRILAAKLEDEAIHQRGAGLSWLIGKAKPKPLDTPGFLLDGRRLAIAGPEVFEADPVNILRLFDLAGADNLDIHPTALAEVTRRLGKITPALRRDPEACAVFLRAATSRRDPGQALRLMNEAGVLGKFAPEFGRIVGQTQFNMYHRYTVDEHTLMGVQVISDIENGRCAKEHPLATQVFPLIQNRRALYLAMLFHDTGKGQGDQQVMGAQSARAGCTRLGLPPDEVELVAWLVGHHLVMSDVAQRRDLSDPRTIASFAEIVGTPERLRLLLVLTVADIRAVGPGVWNDFKAQLLRDLFRSAEAALRGGRSPEATVREKLAEQAAEARRVAGADPRAAGWIAEMEDAYWLGFTPEQHAWHAAEMALCAEAGRRAHVAARLAPARGVTEVLVSAPDRPGLFADLAATFAAAGANVADARIFTTRSGAVFDVFAIQDSQSGAFDGDGSGRLKRLLVALERALRPDAPPAAAIDPPAPKRLAAFAIEPWVAFDNEAAASDTIVEVSGRDRPGLLRDLARAFADQGLAVTSAHVDGVGERVADAFYVRTGEGAKLDDPRRMAALRVQLEAVLLAHEPEAPLTPARRRLARARASAGR